MAGSLAAAHLQILQQEMAQERTRIVRGVAMVAISWICLFAIILLLQAVAVLSLHELLGLRWLWALSLTMAADLLICSLLRFLGTRQLKAPALPATRAMLRRSLAVLRN